MSSIPNVYVSYNWEVEEKEELLTKMQEKNPDINFLLDRQQIKNGDKFLEFIEEISTGDYVLVVLSTGYCRSFYCMYELSKVMQHSKNNKDSLNKRILVIRVDDYRLDDVEEQQALEQHWKAILSKRKKGLDTGYHHNYGTVENLNVICEQLPYIFNYFQDLKAPSDKQLSTTHTLNEHAFQAIREWLNRLLPKRQLKGRSTCQDSVFQDDIVQDEIEDILDSHEVLQQALQKQLKSEEDQLIEKLGSSSSLRELISPTLIKASRKAIRQARKENQDITLLKIAIHDLLAWLGVLYICPKWVVAARKESQENGWIEVPARTGAEQILGAGRLAQVKPTIEARGDSTLLPKYEIFPLKQNTWSTDVTPSVNAIMRFIYNEVFDHHDRNKSPDIEWDISEDERRALNEKIRLYAEDGSRHFYCVLRIEKEHQFNYLNNPELLTSLKQQLPSLDLFRIKAPLDNNLFVATDDSDLNQTYHHFLTELEKW